MIQVPMQSARHNEIVQQIVHPQPENSCSILEELGLAHRPSREQIYKDIEERILTPQDRLPAHWLPYYQL